MGNRPEKVHSWTGLAFFGNMVPPNMHDFFGTLYHQVNGNGIKFHDSYGKHQQCYKERETDWVFFTKIVNTMEQDSSPKGIDKTLWLRYFLRILNKLFDMDLWLQGNLLQEKTTKNVKHKTNSCYYTLKSWKLRKIQFALDRKNEKELAEKAIQEEIQEKIEEQKRIQKQAEKAKEEEGKPEESRFFHSLTKQ